MRSAAVALVASVALAACGEPAIDLALPERAPDQVVLDLAGVLDDEVERRLADFPGLDVVAVTYETAQASRGEAARAGQAVVAAWDADLVLIAVAEPGDFASQITDREDPRRRRRYFGLEPADPRAVPGGLREEIAEGLVPERAAGNDWAGTFLAVLDALEDGLAAR